MLTPHEYFSEMINDSANEIRGNATASNKQASKKIEYVWVLCNFYSFSSLMESGTEV